MATADERQACGERLRTERKRRGWFKPDMARALAEALEAMGERQWPDLPTLKNYILRWEGGKVYPGPLYRAAYARAFGMPEDALFGMAVSGASWEDGTEEDDMRRRTLLGLLATATAAPWAQRAEHVRAEVTGAIRPTTTDRDADTWERVAFDYAHEVGVLPAGQLLPDLLADFSEISGIVAGAHGPVRTRLIHIVARLAALTAITLSDLGDPGGARRWWRTAERAADESGDHLTASMVRGRQAVFSLYADRPLPSVLGLAEQAIEIGHGWPCAGVASGHAAKAQALALLGRHAEAADTLEDLNGIFERLPERTSGDGSSQWGWSLQRLHHVTSHVYTFAGDLERAGNAQDRALALYTGRGYLGRAQVELHRAGCLIAAGDVDEGARHAVRVLESLPAGHRDNGVARRTAVMSLNLAPRTDARRPALRDAYELLALPSGER
ncbi:helix-turn-helix transcriptional regulator [Thermomonospora umbrina]|nr:helix-turn-helix transcriptional regulator [Thermomonospora umbrina]